MMAWERVIEGHPSATADGTDLMTRESRVPRVTKRRQVAALQKSRHLRVIVGLSSYPLNSTML